MKFKFLLVLFYCLAMSLMIVAQTGFKEGYIVNNQHERISCLIRNVGNEESTMDYEYKLKDSKEIEKIVLSKIVEFGIDNELKSIRALVAIDISPNHISNINDTIIKLEEGHAFLKILVEGELASLYSYYYEGKSFFFFSKRNDLIELLVHKKYYIGITPLVYQKILYDNTYQEQLKQYLKCDSSKDVEKISYTKKDLVNYFTDYHKCEKSNYRQFKSSHVKRGVLLLKPGISLNRTQLAIHDPEEAAHKVFFEKQNSVGFGVEVEYFIPFNNYEWSIFTEANYLSYGTDKILLDDKLPSSLYDDYIFDYKSIDILAGLSYNIHLNQYQRLYIKAAYVPQFILASSYLSVNSFHKHRFSPSSRFLIGLGYNYQNMGIELRYYTPQNITQNINKQGSDLSQISLKISYSFQLMGERLIK